MKEKGTERRTTSVILNIILIFKHVLIFGEQIL